MKNLSPSRLLLKFFQWICRSDRLDEIVGDLLEIYEYDKKAMSLMKARWRFTIGLLFFFKPDNFAHKTNINYMLIRNYWHVGWRNLRKYKTYSALNIFGLTIGLVSTWFISLYVLDELIYDRHFSHNDRIYRVALDGQLETDDMQSATTFAPTGWRMKENLSEVEEFASFHNATRFTFKVGDDTFLEKRTFIVSQDFFGVFGYKIIQGDVSTIFEKPASAVLSESKAIEVFGSTDVIGKTIELVNYGQGGTITVTGIMADPPSTGHFRPQIIVFASDDRWKSDSWDDISYYTYVKLRENTSQVTFESQLRAFFERHAGKGFSETFHGTGTFFLQPLTSIHLHSDLPFEIETNGKVRNVQIMTALGLFILLVVSINYMNLSTTRATKRVKEMGIRSMMGSNKRMLRLQYLTESALITWLSLVLSAILVLLLMPTFNFFSGKSLDPLQLLDLKILGVFFLVTLIIGLIGGSYPGFFLSKFNTADIFRKKINLGNNHMPVGKILNALQFTVALTIIILSITAYSQLEFMRNYELGFEKEQVIKVQTGSRLDPKNYETIRTELLKYPAFTDVAATMKSPGEDIGTDGIPFEGPDGSFVVHKTQFNIVDENFVGVLGLQLAAGRNFGDLNSDQWGHAAMVNETLASSLGYLSSEQTLGKEIELPIGNNAKIVGVLKDFHIRGLHSKIEPLILVNFMPIATTVLVKMSTQNMDQSLATIDETMFEIMGHKNHQISFLDQDFWAQYQQDERQTKLLLICAAITVLLSIMGLIALVSFSVELKMKEMTIRKIFGAGFVHIVQLFARQYAIVITVSLAIAIPSSIYLCRSWLDNFAYRTEISIAGIIGTSLGLMTLIFLIIWHQSKRSFRLNPIDQIGVE